MGKRREDLAARDPETQKILTDLNGLRKQSTTHVLQELFTYLLLIPVWGALGAAIATGVAAILLTTLQIYEMGRYENIRFRYRNQLRAVLAALLPLAVVAWADSAQALSWIYARGPLLGVVIKVGLALAMCLLYGAILVGWPGKNPERDWIRRIVIRQREDPIR